MDAGECRDWHVVDLAEPSTFESGAPADDACTRGTSLHVAQDEASVDGFKLHSSSGMVNLETEKLELFFEGVVVWMGGDVYLVHDCVGDIIVRKGLMVFREVHFTDCCVQEGIYRLNSGSGGCSWVSVEMEW